MPSCLRDFAASLVLCWVSPAVSLAALVVLASCDAPPSASTLKEWTAADHDRAEESARAASGQQAPPAPAAASGAQGRGAPEVFLEATWAQQCGACHGSVGHGDGPTGSMVHAADLTQAEWQASVTDAQIARVIVSGKGKMPPFPNLPPKVVSGLVARIRASRGR